MAIYIIYTYVSWLNLAVWCNNLYSNYISKKTGRSFLHQLIKYDLSWTLLVKTRGHYFRIYGKAVDLLMISNQSIQHQVYIHGLITCSPKAISDDDEFG